MFIGYENYGAYGINLNPAKWRLGVPHITITAPVKRGFTIAPFTVIPRRVKGADRTAYIAHEMTHFKQQTKSPLNLVTNIPNLVRYVVQPSYRWRMEKPAFTNEIRSLQRQKVPINYDHYKASLPREYRVSADKVNDFITYLQNTNPY